MRFFEVLNLPFLGITIIDRTQFEAVLFMALVKAVARDKDSKTSENAL